jgi:SAM-dependent methyltransferase
LADERFKRDDARSYDLAAQTFDRLSATYTAPFADELVRIAGVAAGGRVLDLGAGTGIVAKRLTDAGARGIAADLSAGMLRAASRNSPAVRMDAEAFAIRPGSLDAVVSLFAMLHFPEPATVLRACYTALRPGGVLAFAFGAPAPWPGATLRIPRALLDRAMSRAGRLLTAPQTLDARLSPGSDESATPLARRGRAAADELLRLTREAGFRDIQSGWTGRRFVIPSSEEFWELQAVFSSRARKRLMEVDEKSAANLRQDLLRDANRVLDGGGSLIYQVGAAWIRAKKPLK